MHGITLSDGGAWRSFFMFQTDLLQCHQVARQLAATLKYCSVGALKSSTGEKGQINKTGPGSYMTTVLDASPVLRLPRPPVEWRLNFTACGYLTSPTLSSLVYVSSFPKPISDCKRESQSESLKVSGSSRTTQIFWAASHGLFNPFPQYYPIRDVKIHVASLLDTKSHKFS